MQMAARSVAEGASAANCAAKGVRGRCGNRAIQAGRS